MMHICIDALNIGRLSAVGLVTFAEYVLQIKKCRRVHHYVDAGDSSRSNWLRLVNCARFEQEQNLMAFQYKGQMYYR